MSAYTGISSTAASQRLHGLVAPSVSWDHLALLVLGFLLVLALMSVVVSTLAWTGSRRNGDIRSGGGQRRH